MATAVRSDEDLLDYATVFDDEDFLDLFLASSSSHSRSVTQQPSSFVPAAASSILVPLSHQHLTNHHVEDAPAPASSTSYHDQPSDPNTAPPPQPVGGLSTASCSDSSPITTTTTVCAAPLVASSSSNGGAGGVMRIVMLVDPVTDQVTLPQQQVIAGAGNEIVTIGPTVLSNFSKLDFTSLDLGGLLGTTNFSSAAKGIESHQAPSAAPPAPTESKFLPITPFSLKSDASSAWNPQPLVAPSASSHHQPFALGTGGLLPFQSLSLHHHPEPPQTSLAPDRAPSSSLAAAESSSYSYVSESSSLDGHSLTSSSSGSSTSTSTNAPVVPAPTTVAAPLRALSAYNFFFRDERDRILHGGEIEWTKAKQEQLLQNHWNQDRSKKRRHRKSHGKIDFSTLSKVISTRWKELPESQKDFFREVAARDWERFQRELAEYKHGASIDAANAAAAANAATSSNNGAAAAGNSFASFSFSTVIG